MGRHWMKLVVEGDALFLYYRPEIVREGNSIRVVAPSGEVLDEHFAQDSFPDSRIELLAASGPEPDPEVKAEWVEAHMASVMASWGLLSDLVLTPGIGYCDGGEYEIRSRGVSLQGTLQLGITESQAILKTASGDIPLGDDEFSRLWPVARPALDVPPF